MPMSWNRQTLCLLVVGSLIVGCAGPRVRTELDRLYATDFKAFEPPSVGTIKDEGQSKDFPETSFDRVWESALVVLMQKKLVVRGSKESGVIVSMTSPPIAVLVEHGDPVAVHATWLVYLYRDPKRPGKGVHLPGSELGKQKMAERFFDELSTQVYAESKWPYLFKTSSK
jgi:hypothetical protein